MNTKQTDKIVNALGVFHLTARVTPYGAERLLKVIPQLKALNEAHKSQIDAALALGITVTTLRNYVRLLGWEWNNLNRRGPYVGKKGMSNHLDEKLLTQNEAASVLGVRKETVSRWTSARTIPCVRIGVRSVRYVLAEIVKHARSQSSGKEGKS